MGRSRTYSDQQLATAVAAAVSWRGVLRELGLVATSAAAQRSVRCRADELGLDHSHFRGQRRWSDIDLSAAVAVSTTWSEVALRLGLRGGSRPTTLKGHSARLGLSTGHLQSKVDIARVADLRPRLAHLRRAAPLLAAAWFTSCGYDISWPLEPCAYDLVVLGHGTTQRVQVKSSTVRAGSTWVARIAQSGRSPAPYDVDDLDAFFVIDGDLEFYLIPARRVGGLTTIHLSAYAGFRLPQQWS